MFSLFLKFKSTFVIVFLLLSLIGIAFFFIFGFVYFIAIGFLIIWAFFIFIEVIRQKKWLYIISLSLSLVFFLSYLSLVFFGQQLASKIPSFANLIATILWPICTIIPLIGFEYTEYLKNKTTNNVSK
jgi:hypothetical protein